MMVQSTGSDIFDAFTFASCICEFCANAGSAISKASTSARGFNVILKFVVIDLFIREYLLIVSVVAVLQGVSGEVADACHHHAVD